MGACKTKPKKPHPEVVAPGLQPPVMNPESGCEKKHSPSSYISTIKSIPPTLPIMSEKG